MKNYTEMKTNKLLLCVWVWLSHIGEWEKLDQRIHSVWTLLCSVYVKCRNRQNSSRIRGQDNGSFLGRLEGNRGLPVTGNVVFLDLGDIYNRWYVHSENSWSCTVSICMLYLNLKVKTKTKSRLVCRLLGGAWLSEPPLKLYVKFYLNMYVFVYFKGEKILSINQVLRGVHDFRKVKNLPHQSLNIPTNYH